MAPNWIRASGGNVPHNAVKGGIENDGRVLYVARAKNPADGQWTPGKAAFYLGGCCFPYGGKEIKCHEYEVLTRETKSPIAYEWRNCSSGIFPDKERAICTSADSGLYVARGIHDGSLIPGKIADDPIATYVSYGGKEFSCDRYEVMYKINLDQNSSSDNEVKITKYQQHLHDIGSDLMNGIPLLSKYSIDLKAAIHQGDADISFIRDVLYPNVREAKTYFNKMLKLANYVVDMVNTDVENCVHELHKLKDTIKNWEKELAKLEEKLAGKSRDVEHAEQNVERKERELEKSHEALAAAQSKLDKAAHDRMIAHTVGDVLKIFGPIGWLIGSAIADLKALKDEVELCKEVRDSANEELSSSKKCLDNARAQKKITEYKISELSRKKVLEDSYLRDLNQAVDNLKEYKEEVTDLDVKVKKIDMELAAFHENIEILFLETDGGYSLQLLKGPTINVFNALSKLLQSKSVQYICSISEVAEMKTYLQRLEEI